MRGTLRPGGAHSLPGALEGSLQSYAVSPWVWVSWAGSKVSNSSSLHTGPLSARAEGVRAESGQCWLHQTEKAQQAWGLARDMHMLTRVRAKKRLSVQIQMIDGRNLI